MSGLIGGAVHKGLEQKYAFSALNRSEVPGVPTVRADIGYLDQISPAFDDVDTVVHLAALASMSAPAEDILHANVAGTYNVFEAARQAGVKRVVYASSGATVSGWEHEEPYAALVEGRYADLPESWNMITHETPTRPSGIYGTSKVWGEALARHFTDTSPLSIICLRIGMVGSVDRPATARQFSVWCSQRDIVNMIDLCISAPESLRYDIFFANSQNKWGYRDLEHPRRVLGYVPQDAAESYRKTTQDR
jgi:nucleoside-diphosphate-sugar epimerase